MSDVENFEIFLASRVRVGKDRKKPWHNRTKIIILNNRNFWSSYCIENTDKEVKDLK